MLRSLAFYAALFLFVGCSSGATKTAEAPLKEGELPLELFFRNPVARNVMMSPNGQMLLSLQPLKGRMNVFVKPVSGNQWVSLTSFEDRDLASAEWKNDETILFSKDFGGDENFHLFSVNVKTKEARDLTSYPNTRTEMYDNLETISETDVIVGMNRRDPKVYDVYRINTVTGKTDMIFQNPGNYTSFMTDHTGEIRMATATDGVNKTLFYRDNGKSEFKKVKTLNFKESLEPEHFDKNNKNVYATTNLGHNTTGVVEMDPRTGRILKTLYTNKEYDVAGFEYSRRRKELVVASYIDWKMQKHFFSPFFKNIFNDVQKQLPGKEVMLNGANNAYDKFVVVVLSDRSGVKYYTYDTKTKKLDFLLDSTPWLKEEQLVEMKPIEYKSRDGMTIHGYLFLPKGKDPKNLPFVVNPHGGPWARDVWGFQAESQFLANRGYGVLKMNFRGSTGYGKKFWMASFKKWGLSMQDDVTDGVNWIVKQGYADSKRVAIYGASYGGYATLAGLAFTPDLYACGVDYVGVSNIFTLMETIPPYWKPMQEMFYEMVGHPVKEKELVQKASPLFSADKIKKPLFVAQGAKDPRVKKAESDQIVEALKKRGVDVPYLVKDNEGHGFRNEENRFEFYKKMEAFLDKHMTVL